MEKTCVFLLLMNGLFTVQVCINFSKSIDEVVFIRFQLVVLKVNQCFTTILNFIILFSITSVAKIGKKI